MKRVSGTAGGAEGVGLKRQRQSERELGQRQREGLKRRHRASESQTELESHRQSLRVRDRA